MKLLLGFIDILKDHGGNMKLILIRHGETKGNEDGVYQGTLNLSLSEKGINQCLEVKNKLKNFKVDKVYSSTLKRAFESASIIFNEGNIQIVDDFREIDFGSWEGLHYRTISMEQKEAYDQFIKDYKTFTFPEGENFNHFYNRITKAFSDIAKKNKDKTIAIVAHGGTIKSILCELLGIGQDGFYSINVYHGCYSLVSVYEGIAIIEEINK
jgi:alpha-ribazole phosphatase